MAGAALALCASAVAQERNATSAPADASGSELLQLVKKGDERRLRVLLDQGLNVDAPVSHGSTMLMEAAVYGKTKVAALLLTRKPNLDRIDWLRVTALGYAVINRRKDIVEMLLKAGASPDGGKGGYPPLLGAAGYGYSEYVERLLKAGAKVNAADFRGLTALMRAAEQGHRDIVRTLLRAGADRVLTDRWGETALTLAQKKGHKEVEKLLLEVKP